MVILVLASALVMPTVLGALPDRYVARLPEPLQRFGLPETNLPVLPTAKAPLSVRPTVEASLTVVSGDQGITPARNSAIGGPGSGLEASPTLATIEPGTNQLAVELVPPTAVPAPTATATSYPLPDAVRLDGFQHKFQTWNNCGPATLAMALTYFGEQVTQEQTAAVLKPDPEDRNVTPAEMAAYVRDQTPYQALFRANGGLDTLKRLLANDVPVIVEIGIEPPGEYRWLGWYGHYLLLVAYDESEQQFWAYDSWFGTSEEPLQNAHPDGRVLSYADLEKYWAHFNRNYIALYTQEQEELVSELIAEDMDDEVMWGRALARSQAEVNSQPSDPFYWFNLGTNFVAHQRFEEAARAFDQARAIGLPWRMLWYQFGPYEAYYNVGRYEDVILLADTTLDDRPYFEESYYYKGLALNAMGDTGGARESLEKAARFNPNFTLAQRALTELE